MGADFSAAQGTQDPQEPRPGAHVTWRVRTNRNV